MKKLIISAVLALFVIVAAIMIYTYSRDKDVDKATSAESDCVDDGQGSCSDTAKKMKMEKRRTLKIDPRRFTLNRDLLNGTVRKQLQDEGKLPPDDPKKEQAPQPQQAPSPEAKPQPEPLKVSPNLRVKVPMKMLRPAANNDAEKEVTQ